jgi:DNA-binding IclR family transcriptional regulator
MPVMPLDTENRAADMLGVLADLGPGRSASPADVAIACGCSGSTARSVLATLAARGAVAESRDEFGPHYTLFHH